MSTLHSIDEEGLTEVGQDGTEEQPPPCPEPFEMKDNIMNSKLLYVATLAVSLLGSLAVAGGAMAATNAALTRAEVNADLARARADGTLQRSDYPRAYFHAPATAPASTQTRAQVAIEVAEAKASRKALIGPDANRTYNPSGTEILRVSTLSRAEVQAEVLQAAANGTLQRTDDDDATSLRAGRTRMSRRSGSRNA
jgi:hypothetical protein